ncbi:MAG: MFS transporter [Thermoleophilia bacterium]
MSRLAGLRARAGVSPVVWSLGVVSLLADLGSEFAYPLVPVFLTVTLGASPAVLGLIEGLAEGTAAALRPASGAISDRLPRRRPLVSAGYGLSAVGRVLLPLAPGWGAVLAARLVDRVGKGVRTAPRDAMIADATPPESRGRAFGLHRSMDTVGAVGGPLAALVALWALGEGSLRTVLLIAAVPVVASAAVTFRIREPRRRPARRRDAGDGPRPPLPGRYWLFLGGWALFAVGNSSDAFLILRARELLGSAAAAVAAYALFNVVAAVASFPAGVMSDRLGRRIPLLAGLGVFAAVYAVVATAPAWPVLLAAFAAYGLYLALTDGVSRALVSTLAPAGRAGEALGLFAGVTAAAAVAASVGGGLLWDRLGPGWTFGAGAVLAAAGAAVLTACPMHPPPQAVTSPGSG